MTNWKRRSANGTPIIVRSERRRSLRILMLPVMFLRTDKYPILDSISGIGPVYAAGRLAEIAGIERFPSQAALAKFTGLWWKRTQSGDFEAELTHLAKSGNKYLRYY